MPKRQINSIDSSATINNELTFDQTTGLSIKIDEKIYNFNGNKALMKFLNSASMIGYNNKHISNMHYVLDLGDVNNIHSQLNELIKESKDGVSWAD